MIYLKQFIDFVKNHPKWTCVAIFIVSVLIANLRWNREHRDEGDFLKSINLNITLKVIAVVPTDNHGYGVIYGEVISSNKPRSYSAIYDNNYTFCKMSDNKILFVSDFYTMKKNDSVIINSSVTKYWVFRKGKLVSENKLTNTTDDLLYRDIEKNKYLDFNTYESNI